jgi:AcrR family transcriptional regulator
MEGEFMDDLHQVTEGPRRRSGRPDKPIPRSELLRVARGLFADHGYAGVSMADIAHKAGLQKSSLFHHFPTKARLYHEVLDGVLAEIAEPVHAAYAVQGEGFVARLDAASVAAARALGDDPTRARITMRELLNQDGTAAHLDVIVRIIEATTAFFEAGAAAGAWPQQDFHQVVLTIAGIHCFYFSVPAISQRVGGGDPFSADAVERRVQTVRAQVRQLLGLPATG